MREHIQFVLIHWRWNFIHRIQRRPPNRHHHILLYLPIIIDILMNLRTHQRASTRKHVYVHGDYTNRLPIRDVWNTAYYRLTNLHRNYKLESMLITHQRVPTD